jgi:hypothetical protein
MSPSSRGSQGRPEAVVYIPTASHRLYRFTYTSSRLLNDWPLMKNKPVSATQRFSLLDLLCPFSSNCVRSCPVLQSQLTIQCDLHNSTHKKSPSRYTHWETKLDSRLLEAQVICAIFHSRLSSSITPIRSISPKFSRRISRLPERS